MTISRNFWQVKVWKAGMWEQNNLLREIVRRMENVVWKENPLQEIIRRMENL